mgnify:CR=1 FL=1
MGESKFRDFWVANKLTELAPLMKRRTPEGLLEFSDGIDDQRLSDHNREQQAAQGYIRVADGGVIDNTSLAYLLRHMQNNKNNILPDGSNYMDDFRLVLFMSSTSPGVTLSNRHVLPEDLAKIFGFKMLSNEGENLFVGSDEVGSAGGQILAIPVMSSWVFDRSVWDNISGPVWEYRDQASETHLRYYELSVTTVENKTFGVNAGHRGTLHIFIGTNFNSGPFPTNNAGFRTYQGVYESTRRAVFQEGGWPHLKKALGLD